MEQLLSLGSVSLSMSMSVSVPVPVSVPMSMPMSVSVSVSVSICATAHASCRVTCAYVELVFVSLCACRERKLAKSGQRHNNTVGTLESTPLSQIERYLK